MQLGMKEDQPFKNKKTSLKRWILQVNEAVSREDLKGVGTHFNLALQKANLPHQPDNLMLYPSSQKLLTNASLILDNHTSKK